MATSCAPVLRKLSNSPNPSKLTAFFTDDLPDSVRVKGTSDSNKVNPAGHWISKEKYDSLNKTLEMLNDSGSVLRECAYDTTGNLVSPCSVLFLNNNIARNGADVTVTWDVMSEQGITKYYIEATPDQSSFSTIDEQLFDATKSGSYSKTVSPPAGTQFFRLTGVCSSGALIRSDLFA